MHAIHIYLGTYLLVLPYHCDSLYTNEHHILFKHLQHHPILMHVITLYHNIPIIIYLENAMFAITTISRNRFENIIT